MNINKLIKEAHKNAIEKGFYDCPVCDGDGDGIKGSKIIGVGEVRDNFQGCDCHNCNNTGIDPNKNIPELLMLVITEISEAVEALRCEKFADWESYNTWIKEPESYLPTNTFELYIKDTFEDEIADVFIRLADLCGYMNIDIEKHIEAKMQYNKTIGDVHG